MSEVMASVRSNRSPRTVRIVGDITLMEAWTSNNPDRTFTNQTFEIREETKSSRLGRDGRLIVTCRPMNVTWYGGKAEYLQDVARVRIVACGYVLIDEPLDTQQGRSMAAPGRTRAAVVMSTAAEIVPAIAEAAEMPESIA